ncbi:preprotein translocase subunit SecA [Candidatus Mycoplasma mahonii]|uniref:preprotein translocase subunit SecA n=1 Tax=Candidatus Mycoplasma mahonii TaxID=3004105 RepID=UPI0026F14FD8|nr:preprotein translocase subunit SecA [Candidatus Mycoplasma mahonii]WKX02503.1 preprotein translocase subunit SecA [Candidatus Mycoplasma mahonii]
MKFKSVELRRAQRELVLINELSDKTKALTDEELKTKTNYFKEQLEKGVTLEKMRPEVFATIREAIFRVLKKRPFDVQMIGGLILDYGSVAEMKTGEGKTIASIAPVYLNALGGKGVLVSTVNEYLTKRDAEEMGKVHNFMGLTVGINKRDMPASVKREAYAADITYSVHSEVGFDYLKDNMVKKMEDKVQRGFNYALIDEVDSILIDEAKTPLIITGGAGTSSQLYLQVDTFVKQLKKEDYDIDMESKSVQLASSGIDSANKFFNVENFYHIKNSDLVHRVTNSLRANLVMARDAEYIVRENKIELVDSFTGRIMEGRSYSDGLHQAIQAKEYVKIEEETQTMATITYQNLFRMFKKLSGMTGTAKTEESEFLDIYNMRVTVVDTNKPLVRIDHPDKIYVSKKYKYEAMIKDIEERQKKGQPILLGTEEVSESERVSKLLKKLNITHTVLNAKQNESEAEIISRAGEARAVTIATNMAGRGTDIQLSPESLAAGGLCVIGTNKAEARRIDNQLKGRSGRQGDIGESQFYLSLEDTLLARFSNQEKLLKAFKGYEDKQIKSGQIKKALNRAQVKIEGFNYDSRKNVLQYDDVIRQQRDLIYAQRDIIIGHTDLINVINRMANSVVKEVITEFPSFRNKDDTINIEKMCKTLNFLWFNMVEFKLKSEDFVGKMNLEIIEEIQGQLADAYSTIREVIVENTSEDSLHEIEREILIRTFDDNWKLHIDQMSKLKSSSSLASYAQKNPFQIYIEEGGKFFKELLRRISHNTVKLLLSNKYGIKRNDVDAQQVKAMVAAELQKAEAQKLEKENKQIDPAVVDKQNAAKKQVITKKPVEVKTKPTKTVNSSTSLAKKVIKKEQ